MFVVRETPDDRFDRMVEPEPMSGCHIWIGSRNNDGYGRLGVNGRMVYAHRFSYERMYGPLAPGRQALHKCDVPACVNPLHLYSGTISDNLRDMHRRGRAPKPIRPHMGEQHGMAKLTRDAVLEIERLVCSGRTRASVAEQFGVGLAQVDRIVNHKTWRHVFAERPA